MRTLVLTALVLASHVLGAQAASVTIENAGPKLWRATYHLAKPAVTIRFDRPASFFREKVWKVQTPGYRLTRSGEWQVLALDSGATPKADIVVEFAEFTEPLPKEYELFQPFSDGAVALYTGHFHAQVTGPSASDTSRVRFLRIRTMPQTHAVVRGKVQRGLVDVRDDAGDGTYVYIGTARPIETPDVVAIVDPGMPAWLSATFSTNLPKLFHEYAKQLGAALPWKPVVLFSFDERGTGTSSGGGTLTGLLNMTLTGAEWRNDTPAHREQAFQLIAHESAHLWNGQLVSNRNGTAGAWMHEGAADAMGAEMLRRFGIIDSARYRARLEEAVNRCSAGVASGSVATALSRGQVRTVYDCGVVMAVWTAAANAKRDDALFAFWQRLIAAGRDNDNTYDDTLYFDVLRKNGVSPDVIRRMQTFIASRDSMSIAAEGLSAFGVRIREGTGTPPAGYQLDLARAAMMHLMQQACGRTSFYWGTPVRTVAMPSCAPFATEMQIHRVQGLRIGSEGAALYDAVRAACANGGNVALQDDAGATLSTVPCTKTLAIRWKWYVLD